MASEWSKMVKSEKNKFKFKQTEVVYAAGNLWKTYFSLGVLSIGYYVFV